jgi:Asp-tRNA(Asn)/Glu-tRNA(Gln) amidotransferase A subunit family amidase
LGSRKFPSHERTGRLGETRPAGRGDQPVEENEAKDGVEEDMLAAIMQFTGVPSLTGLPSLALPCGFDADGLPIGLQVIGRPFDEVTLFRIGAAFQEATDFHKQAPAFGE